VELDTTSGGTEQNESSSAESTELVQPSATDKTLLIGNLAGRRTPEMGHRCNPELTCDGKLRNRSSTNGVHVVPVKRLLL
jgi:hypothetical protein